MKTIYVFIAILLLSSCSTALQVSSVKPAGNIYPAENMEFIGFKNAKKNHHLLKNFARNSNGIA